MKHTECEDCELSQGDCGHHFKSEIYSNTGITTNYDIASLSACDQYGNCMFFKSKTEPNGDLISRKALEEVINDLFITGEYDCNSVLKAIDNAPTVDLDKTSFIEGFKAGCEHGKKCYERPQGAWITTTRNNLFGEEVSCYKCSICGQSHIPLMMTLIFEKIPFCPNCGADMKGGAK